MTGFRFPRIITRHRFFSACVILSLGVGISTAASVITVIDSLRFGALPFGHADRVEHLYLESRHNAGGRLEAVPATVYRELRAGSPLIEDVAAYQVANMRVRDGERTFSTFGARTTANFATLLGPRVVLGRSLDSADAGASALLLGYQFWRIQLGGDSSVIGRSIELNGQLHHVVGVAAREWVFPDNVAFWAASLDPDQVEEQHGRLAVMVRLTPGAAAGQARAQFLRAGEAAMAGARQPGNQRLASATFRDFVGRRLSGVIFVLTVIAVIIGFLTAVNFAGLVLARGILRRGEIGVRAALGASLSRLARHILGESLVLCGLGGLVAALLAPVVIEFLSAGFRGILPVWLATTLSWRSLALSVVLAMAFGIVFALGPALDLARPALAGFLHSAGSTIADGGRLARTRSWVVGIQVALATSVLTALGAVMGKSLLLRAPAPGFEDGPLIISTVSDSGRAADVAGRLAGVRVIAAGTQGIGAAAYVDGQPVDPARLVAELGSATTTADAADVEEPWLERVGEGFFDVMRPRVIAGRLFTADEEARGAPVAVVTRAIGHALYGDAPLGERIRFGGDASRTIVGVIDDIRLRAWQPDPTAAVFMPMPDRDLAAPGQTVRQLWMRATAPVPVVLRAMRSRPAYFYNVGTAHISGLHSLADGLARERDAYGAVIRLMLMIFGVALGLAALGIHGLVSYTAEMRSRELAIREALGASRPSIAGQVLRGAFFQALGGASAGAMLAVIAVDYLSGFQPRITALGGATVAAFGVIGLTVLIASLGPLARTWRRDLSYTLRT